MTHDVINDPCLMQKRMDRVLDMLDWWSDRFTGHFVQKREHPRRRFRANISVYPQEEEGTVGESRESTGFTVRTRNISGGGICFLYEEQIKGTELLLCLDPELGGSQWYKGTIVRKRPVHDGYWEYGVRFTGRATM